VCYCHAHSIRPRRESAILMGAAVAMPAARWFYLKTEFQPRQAEIKNGAPHGRAELVSMQRNLDQEAAARGALLRELRWKNSAWLATAETIAGWNGFEIRNAGSGRSPVRKRSG
jgi:hypothetical protein